MDLSYVKCVGLFVECSLGRGWRVRGWLFPWLLLGESRLSESWGRHVWQMDLAGRSYWERFFQRIPFVFVLLFEREGGREKWCVYLAIAHPGAVWNSIAANTMASFTFENFYVLRIHCPSDWITTFDCVWGRRLLRVLSHFVGGIRDCGGWLGSRLWFGRVWSSRDTFEMKWSWRDVKLIFAFFVLRISSDFWCLFWTVLKGFLAVGYCLRVCTSEMSHFNEAGKLNQLFLSLNKTCT